MRLSLLRGACLFSILVLCSNSGAQEVEPSAWTNQAGHVLLATPQSVSDERVTFLLPNGETNTMLLSVFPESEQTRLRRAVGDIILPAGLMEVYIKSRHELAQAHAMLAREELDQNAYGARRASILKLFERHAAPRLADESLTEEDYTRALSELESLN